MGTSHDGRIAPAVKAMEQAIAYPWRVRDLAAIAELSPSRFAHIFRETIGVSPVQYLRQLRIERAGQLLARTSLPVADVMRLVGCPDPSHFVRTFRNRFGVSPSEYRRARGPL